MLVEKIDTIRMSRMPQAEFNFVRSEMAWYQSALAQLDSADGGTVESPKIKSWLDMTGGKRSGRG